MGRLRILLALLSVVSGDRIKDEYQCYAENENPYLYFGTKTSYAIKFKNPEPPFQREDCSAPLRLWELIRHGTRFPMFEEHRPLRQLVILKNRILRNHKIFRNVELCDTDLKNLMNWTFDIPISESNRLTQQGCQDMEALAVRHRQRYPQLFQAYRQDQFLFKVTEAERTNQSAQHFFQALFPEGSILQPEAVNSLLRSYTDCSTWMLDYASSRAIHQQKENFYNSLLLSELVDRVSRRLGFFFDIRPSQVDAMYKMCAYDKAYKPAEVSAWCAAFTDQELKIMEYREDLVYYYKHGPGMDINLKMACPLLRDMFVKLNESISQASMTAAEALSQDNTTLSQDTASVLESVSQDNATEPVAIYFTHNGMFERFLARLGVLNDSDPLTAEYDYNDERTWRLGRFIPFAANLVVTLHSCSDGYKVVFYLNERPLELDGCPGGVCDWEPLYDKFQDIINSSTCNLDMCYVAASPPLRSLSHWAALLLFTSTLYPLLV